MGLFRRTSRNANTDRIRSGSPIDPERYAEAVAEGTPTPGSRAMAATGTPQRDGRMHTSVPLLVSAFVARPEGSLLASPRPPGRGRPSWCRHPPSPTRSRSESLAAVRTRPHPLHWGAVAPLYAIVVMLANHHVNHTGEITLLLSLQRGEAWEEREEVEENHISTVGSRVRPPWVERP